MVRHSDVFVERARQLVGKEHMSYSRVAGILKVDRALVAVWCRGLKDISLNNVLAKNEMVRKRISDSEKEVIVDLPRNLRFAKLCCALLYGCEGAKYPATNLVSLTNSDPLLIKVFKELLERAFDLDKNRWKIHLQVHSDQNYEDLVIFWGRLLDISSSHFYRPTITRTKGGKHRRKYYGTCSLRYGDYRLQLKLIGIFDEFLRKYGCKENIPIG